MGIPSYRHLAQDRIVFSVIVPSIAAAGPRSSAVESTKQTAAETQTGEDDDSDEDKLRPLSELLLPTEKPSSPKADARGEDSGESEPLPAMDTFNLDMQDRSQDDIARQSAKALTVARHFRSAHNDMLKSLASSIFAVTNDKISLPELNRQVIETYENHCRSGEEAKEKVGDPLVRKLVWGKPRRIDLLLREAHTNITSCGGAIWHQQVTEGNVQPSISCDSLSSSPLPRSPYCDSLNNRSPWKYLL